MNKVSEVEMKMKDFLIKFHSAFMKITTPQQDNQQAAQMITDPAELVGLAANMKTTIGELKELDVLSEEELDEQVKRAQLERQVALDAFLAMKAQAEETNNNLKDNIDNLASQLYDLND